MYNIDIELIYQAITFFKRLGYRSLSAPMLVDGAALYATMPKNRKAKPHLNLFYVGSAEQSFLYLLDQGNTYSGKYMMITPCQRDEDVQDERHLEIFLKIELVAIDDTISHQDILNDAKGFFESIYKGQIDIVPIAEEQSDLEINGVEVGSYGIRNYNNNRVVYGTGLALPRFTQAISRQG